MSAMMLQILLSELFSSFVLVGAQGNISFFSQDDDEDDFYGDDFYGDDEDEDDEDEDEDGGNWFDNEDEWDNY